MTHPRKGVPLKWTAETLATLKAEMAAFARRETARALGFRLRQLCDHFGVNEKVVAPIVHEWEAAGLIAPLGARGANGKGNWLGYAWVGIARPALTLADLMQGVAPAGSVGATPLAHAAGFPPAAASPTGEVVDPTVRAMLAAGAPPTLPTASDAAPAIHEAAAAPRAQRGRRSDDALEALSDAQWKDVKSVANLIARYAPGADGSWASVKEGTLIGWNAERGEWALLDRVREWSDRNHREGWERKQRAAGGRAASLVWSPALNTGRTKHVASAKNLLDVAVRRGLIERAPLADVTINHVAAEWKREVAAWRRRLRRHFPQASAAILERGLRQLALHATRRREFLFASTDWQAVREAILAEYEATRHAKKNTAYQDMSTARQVWRLALQLLTRERHPLAAAIARDWDRWKWETQQDRRISLVPDGAIVDCARHVFAETPSPSRIRDDFAWAERWVNKEGAYVRSLVEGPNGLQDWVVWSTVPVTTLERLSQLPTRSYIDPDPQVQRGLRRATAGEKVPYHLGEETLVGRLRELARLAGYAQYDLAALDDELAAGTVKARYDFAHEDGLRELCNLNLVLGYATWRREEASDEEQEDGLKADLGVQPVVALMAKNLSKVASPYLEGRALRRAEAAERKAEDARTRAARARASGRTDAETALLRQATLEVEAAAAERAEAARLRQVGIELKVWGYRHSSAQNAKKNIKDIADAWAGGDNREGWLKLGDLVDLLLGEIERAAGLTVEAQLDAIRRAAVLLPHERAALLRWQTHEWASLVRSAMLINFLRKLPVRARAASEMRLEWWTAIDPATRQRTDAWAPTAAVQVRIPGAAMKTSSRDYHVSYLRPEHVGDPQFERGAYRELVELWLRPHGARQFALTMWEPERDAQGTPKRSSDDHLIEHPTVISSPYFFPSMAEMGNGGRGTARQTRRQTGLRWNSAALSVHFENTVRAHARAIGLDLELLDRLHGALRLHVIRLLYGTYWAPRQPEEAALMLHHADSSITTRLYCGLTSHRVALEAPLGERLLAPRSAHRTRTVLEGDTAQAERDADDARQRAARAEAEAERLRRLVAAMAAATGMDLAAVTAGGASADSRSVPSSGWYAGIEVEPAR